MIGTVSMRSIQGITRVARSTSPPEQKRMSSPFPVSRQPFSRALLPEMIWARRPER
jgi:hypothetical protein